MGGGLRGRPVPISLACRGGGGGGGGGGRIRIVTAAFGMAHSAAKGEAAVYEYESVEGAQEWVTEFGL